MTDRAKLVEILRTAGKALPDVTEKKWFGCEALVTNDNIFAFVWKEGRLGVKLTDEARYASLLSQKGAAPWKAGEKVMSSWVFVPTKLEDPKAVLPWLKEAHAMASSAAAKPKKKTAAAKKKKTTAKKKTTKKKAQSSRK